MEQIKNQDTGEMVAVFCMYHRRWEVLGINCTIAPNLCEDTECALTSVAGTKAGLTIVHFTELHKLMSFLIFHGLYPLSGLSGFGFDRSTKTLLTSKV